ncbi:MAG: pyridoxamine kinase [Mailhella sp.]|nr:pyridoxamine kinase [Mailhella sp.]
MQSIPLKRAAAIHDLSGFGRASLTVAIPVLATMGIQVCPLPTAVLSSQTSGVQGFSFLDLTENMSAVMNHWAVMGLRFDAVYSGFLGSPEQSGLAGRCIREFLARDGLVVVDPVLGDNGSLDPTQTPDMIEAMRRLVTLADIITPNFTEACFLLDEPYRPDISKNGLKDFLRGLTGLGAKTAVITSAPSGNAETTSTIAYDGSRFWRVDAPHMNAFYPGTGDAFASVLTGSLLQGDSLPVAVDRAVQFVLLGIRATYGYNTPHTDGVLLERTLPSLRMPFTGGTYTEF